MESQADTARLRILPESPTRGHLRPSAVPGGLRSWAADDVLESVAHQTPRRLTASCVRDADVLWPTMHERAVTPVAWTVAPPTVTRHRSALGSWESAVSPAPAALAGLVREYVGWWEDMATPLVRRELPTDEAPLIFAFGAPFRLFDLADPTRFTDTRSFATGAYDTAQLVGSTGPSGGVQVNLTLLGMRRLLGQPLAPLTNRAVALDDVFGAGARHLTDALHDLRTWEARFALVTQFIATRVESAPPPVPHVEHAWRRIIASRGRIAIGAVADELGWSQKHLIDRMRSELGLAPKMLARIVRFGHAVRAVKHGRVRRLADLSLACGYCDQAHLARDVRVFAGVTPSELMASLLPDRGGFVTDTAAHGDR